MLKTELKRMLAEFIQEIREENWFGKEHELVSRFAFSKLVNNIGCCTELHSTEQFGIEVRVKPKHTIKKEVRKDLVIWRQANQTVWTSDQPPHCIIEWKRENRIVGPQDIEWLKKYTEDHPSTFGIALNIEFKPICSITAVLIEKGKVIDPEWL